MREMRFTTRAEAAQWPILIQRQDGPARRRSPR
jgi:hypothetical protein